MPELRTLALGSAAAMAVAACMMAASPAAFANILAPGGSGAPDALPFGGTGVVASTSGSFTSNLGASDFSGSFSEFVERDSLNTFGAGDLTWYIEVTNNSGSAQAIEHVTASSFSGFKTDVGFLSGISFNTPDLVGRGPGTGSDIDFSFDNGQLVGGNTSEWLDNHDERHGVESRQYLVYQRRHRVGLGLCSHRSGDVDLGNDGSSASRAWASPAIGHRARPSRSPDR